MPGLIQGRAAAFALDDFLDGLAQQRRHVGVDAPQLGARSRTSFENNGFHDGDSNTIWSKVNIQAGGLAEGDEMPNPQAKETL